MRRTGRWSQLRDGYLLHDSTGRPRAQCSFEAIDRLTISLGASLDTTIVEIADKTVEAFMQGGRAGKEPIAHTLHPPANQKLTRDNHRSMETIGRSSVLVGARGFEPPTPRSRTECSTRLSHAPTQVIVLQSASRWCVPPLRGTYPARPGSIPYGLAHPRPASVSPDGRYSQATQPS